MISKFNPMQRLSPLQNFICTIGNLPTSYALSLSYEEQIMWLCNFLEKTIMPAIEENTNITEETQQAFVELQQYVTDYFNNLDVQEEINNKLDEMAESGVLAEIINQEIFSSINNQINLLNSKRTVVIGDSYLRGDHHGIASVNGWGYYLQNLMGLSNNNFYNFSEGGAGFVANGDHGNNFLSLLQSNISNITNKDTIKNVVICGGCNDRNSNINTISNNMKNMINYCKTQFPNAKIYVGMIGNNASISDETYRRNVILNSLIAYKKCNEAGAYYLTGVEYLMHNYNFYDDTDNTHPTEAGYKKIGEMIYNLLIGLPYYQATQLVGKLSIPWNPDFNVDNSSTQFGFTLTILNNIKHIFFNTGEAHLQADDISFVNNLLQLTDDLPFNFNYRNFYTNYTPGWCGNLLVKFADEQQSTLINGYYMVRNNKLYFNTFGYNDRIIERIYIPNTSVMEDLLLS